MGISANQARLMTLTARQHDLELRAQQISAQKMIKGLNSQDAAMSYSKALNNYALIKQAENVTADSTTQYDVKADGSFSVIAQASGGASDGDAEFLGSVFGPPLVPEYQKPTPGIVTGKDELITKVAVVLSGKVVSSADEYLELEKSAYNALTTSLSAEEKLLDMELTQINTEHNAVKTEYDSVKGLVGENVDKSFNVFG